MTKSLLGSDLHMRRGVDEQYALVQFVDAAIQLQVKKVVLAGDLFNNQTNRAEPVAFFSQQIDRLEEKGIAFYYTQGQHDWDDPPWLSAHKWARHLHGATTNIGPYKAYGLDFQHFGKLQEALQEIPTNCNMLVAHQTWGDWMGDIAAPQGTFSEVPGHIEVVYSGDLHKRVEDIVYNADGSPMQVYSSGAMTQQRITESCSHYYILVTDNGKFVYKKLKSRVMIEAQAILAQEDLTRFMQGIEETLAIAQQKVAALELPDGMLQPVLYVTYAHSVPETVRRITKIIGNRALLHWKALPPEEKTSAGKSIKKAGADAVTPLSVLGEEIDKEERPDAFELAARMLEKPENHEEEFQRWWIEKIGE